MATISETTSMNQTKSPGPQVIACGLPRTGTTTIGKALAILLNGPVSDTVADTFLRGSRSQINDLFRLHTLPPNSPELRELIHKILTADKPYVASTDNPMPHYLKEIMDLYPDCKFICTTREREGWVKSFQKTQGLMMTLVPWRRLWWRLGLFMEYLDGFRQDRILYNYGGIPPGVRMEKSFLKEVVNRDALLWMWERHHEYIRRVVPEDKLLMYDVREGWEPLCRFLEVDESKVEGVPFPHEFSGKGVEEMREELVGWMRWRWRGLIVVMTGAVISAAWLAWQKSWLQG